MKVAVIRMEDLSMVIDKAGNPLAMQSVQAQLKKFTYISKTEQKSIESSGNQLQIFVLLLFLLQLVMKLFLKTTMQHIWEVVH